MNYMKLIRTRKSTRDFKNEAVNDKKLEGLIKYLDKAHRLVPDIQLEAILFKDGDYVFDRLDGCAGYNGMMIKAPSYIIIVSDNKEGYIENTAFVGENMILKAVEEGLDTCWISFQSCDSIKERLCLDTAKEVTGIIAVGNALDKKKVLNPADTGDNYSKSDMKIVVDNTSFRYSLEDIIYYKQWGDPISYDELERRGLMDAFSYARLAPSSLNTQPWKFILDEGHVVLTIKDDPQIIQREEKMNAGVIMLYFYLISSDTLYGVQWHLGKPEKEYEIPEEYKIVSWARL